MVSPKSLSNGTQRHVPCNIQAQIAICCRSKRHSPLKDRYYYPYELVIFFRLTGSKRSQYLRIQPSDYVGSPILTGGEREGKGRGNLPLRRENCIPKGHPSIPA
jgi:hypothetical protein